MERALKRVGAIVQGSPLDPSTMIGAQASSEQLEKILSYIDIGKKEGAEVLIGGERNVLSGELKVAIMSSRPCSRATTRCVSSRKRSSGLLYP
jgi:acyl-CoA reductase-like NAD-dependent aldehyde dehydrogenase